VTTTTTKGDSESRIGSCFRSWAAVGSPIWGGLIAYGVYRLFFIESNIQGIEVGLSALELPAHGLAASGSLHATNALLGWSVTGAFLVLAFGGAIFVLADVIHASLRSSKTMTIWVTIVVTAAIAVLVGYASSAKDPFTVLAFEPILNRTFELLDMSRAGVLFDLFTPMVLAVTIFFMAAASSTLADKKALDESAALHLKDQFRHLNRALLAGATMLVAGIVFAGAMHRLPSIFIDETSREAWHQLIDGLSAGLGAAWTLVLIGIYLPPVFILYRRARTLALQQVTEKTPEKISEWLANQKMTASIAQKLPYAAALLSPLIVGGPAAQLLKLITA